MDNGGSENILKFLNYKNGSFERGLGVDSYDNLNNLFSKGYTIWRAFFLCNFKSEWREFLGF